MIKRKTILIGIDGCTWNYINPLLEKGRLLNIKYLIKNGTSGILNSTIPPFSPVAWSTFITGTNPDIHGIFDWCKYDTKLNKIRPISARDRRVPAFWHYLNKVGLRVGVLNLPSTFPAEKIDGFIISGFDSPDDSCMKYYPRELYEEIKRLYGGDMKVPPFSAVKSEEDRLKFFQFYEDYSNKKTDIALKLIEDYRIDVFIINYSIIDHLNHIIKDYGMIEKALEVVDINIGRYLNKYPDANYVVFSDHGSVRIGGSFAIVEWLNDNGYIEIGERKREFVKINTIIHNIFSERFKLKGNKEKILRRAIIAPLLLLPKSILSKITYILSNNRTTIRYWPQSALNLRKSKIIYCSTGSNGIYLNHKRNADKKEINIDELIQDLLDIRDPIYGEPIIDKVYKKEDIYRATKFRNHAPDLILRMSGPYVIWISDVIEKREHKNKRYFYNNDEINYFGGHTNEGIFIFYGEAFNNMNRIKELNIVDIPAIILYLNGVSIPKEFDGIIKKELFSKYFLRFNETKHQKEKKLIDNDKEDESDADSEEIKKVQKKLSDLGYM